MSGLRQLLAQHRVGRRPSPRPVHDPVELAAEAELVAEERHAALEGQGGQGDPPAVADLAHDVVGAVRAPSKKTSLNSTVRVSWVMGRTSIPGWSMGTRR